MNHMRIGSLITTRRRELGITQQALADRLNISFQAVSKWENGSAYPDIELLPLIASQLGVTMDALFGYSAVPVTDYDKRYETAGYYWGICPNSACYEIMKLKPPVSPFRVLDIGCGEGKDAVFLARNGYRVTAFDGAEKGIEKAKLLAEKNHVRVDFFKADIHDFVPTQEFDIIFSSGVLHYLNASERESFLDNLKLHTADSGIHVLNVFVRKPFIGPAPDGEQSEQECQGWKSGELFTCYHDWMIHQMDEIIFDCNSGGIPHKHCMDIMIAEKHR